MNSENTLDEPVWETVKRDLMRIGRNLVMVVFPFQDRSQQTAALRNWVCQSFSSYHVDDHLFYFYSEMDLKNNALCMMISIWSRICGDPWLLH